MLLHITNDYSGSTVYKNLVKELDDLNVQQIVYNPVRNLNLIGKNIIDLQTKGSDIIYSHILNNFADRILYKNKIRKIVKDIEQKVTLSKVTFIHAHTWYSDGGVAYELHKKYGIPYIVAVRNTDINLFLKYFLFERNYGMDILRYSKKIITISRVYKKRLLEDTRLAKIKNKLINDIEVVPNGLDPFWIQNQGKRKEQLLPDRKIKLLYIGNFNKGKNVYNLVKAVINLNSTNPAYQLTLIGGKGKDQERILKLIDTQPDIQYVGPIYDLEELKTYYRNSDIFTMPSKAETFGLVYVEALLQGLPILYTQNEGIDGSYESAVGEKVKNLGAKEIEYKIRKIVANYSSYDFAIDEIAMMHQWNLIAMEYIYYYKSI